MFSKNIIEGITILFSLFLPCLAYIDEFNEGYPDINDLFSTKHIKDDSIDLIPGVFFKNITVNIEKLNLTKFRKKLELLDAKSFENATRSGNESLGINVNDTRRQILFWGYGISSFKAGSVHMTKVKALDLMLQLIYMARHKLRDLESCKYFSRTDTGYRIAFVYRKLRRLVRRMMDVYTIMYRNRQQRRFYHDWFIQLHLKATKLHVDFLYLWWILIRVDEKYSKLHGITSPVPKWMSLTRPTVAK